MLLLLLLANRLELSTKLVVLFNDERGELVHVLGRLQQPRIPATHARGVVLKRSGGQDLDKDFYKQFRPTYTYTHIRQKHCHSESLVLSCDTATRV